MTTKAVLTQGIELYYAASSTVATKIAQITSAPPPIGGARAQIDITSLDSTEREYAGGLVTPVAETFGLIFNPLDVSHQNLIALKNSGMLVPWWLGLSDGTIAPTVTQSETTRSNEVSITTTGATSSNTINWAQVSGATGYRIYRSTTAGTEAVYYTVGAVGTYLDTNAGTAAGSPPANNTAAITVPIQAAATTSASGGTLAAATYYYVITALNSVPGQFITTPVARSFFYFLGYVSDLSLSTPIGDVVKGTVTIQRSGASILVPHT